MSRPSLAIALMLMLAAFVWLSRVVAGSLAGFPVFAPALAAQLGDPNGTEGPLGFTQGAQLTPQSVVQQPETLSILVLVSVALGYIIYKGRKIVPRDRGNRSGSYAYSLVALVAFVALLVAGRTVFELLASLSRSAAKSQVIALDLPTLVYVSLAGVGGVAFASLAMFLVRRRVGGVREEGPRSDPLARDFTQVLRDTIYAMRSGSDFRETVLGCYAALCHVLQDGGASDRPELTAREFEVMATARLDLKTDHLRKITNLFEKARYSRDDVNEADAREAEESLLSLEREIRGRSAGQVGGVL